AYLTGEHMLDRAGVKAGERVLVTGASGGVGSGLIQLCRARGAIPYAVAGKGKEARAKAIGAEAVVTRGEGDLPAAVARATRAGGIDGGGDGGGRPPFHDPPHGPPPPGRPPPAGAPPGPRPRPP